MPRLSADLWLEVRAKREAGLTFPALADEYGVDKAAICRRAKREEWADSDGLAGVLRQKVNAKVNRIDTANKAAALTTLEAAADRADEIIKRHREDWERHHQLFPMEAIAQDNDLARKAKIVAEMLTIRQKGERASWGMEEVPSLQISGTVNTKIGVEDNAKRAEQAWLELERIRAERKASQGDMYVATTQ